MFHNSDVNTFGHAILYVFETVRKEYFWTVIVDYCIYSFIRHLKQVLPERGEC